MIGSSAEISFQKVEISSLQPRRQPNLLASPAQHLCRSKYFDFLQQTISWTQTFCYPSSSAFSSCCCTTADL